MGWKSVVVCACLAPVLAGCGALRHAGSRSPGDAERVALPDAGARTPTRWAQPAPPASKFGPTAADVVAERRPPAPDGAEKSIPPLPKPELPVIKPFDPPVPSDANVKFVPSVPLPDPDLLPVPYPPLAVPAPRLPEPVSAGPVPAVPTVLDTIPPVPFVPPPAPPK